MSITTEKAEGWAQACDFCSLPSVATGLRSLAAERDTLKAAINEALTEELPIEGGTWSQEPIGPNETAGETIRRLIKHRVQIGRQAERDALRAERDMLKRDNEIMVGMINDMGTIVIKARAALGEKE